MIKRRVVVDCGAGGNSLEQLILDRPDFEFFAFEPNPALIPGLERIAKAHPDIAVTIFSQAVWTYDGEVSLYLGHPISSTLVQGKQVPQKFGKQIDYTTPQMVPCIDFSQWLAKELTWEDYIVVKMDIEGAEYAVLEKALAEKTIALIDELVVEWHYKKFTTITEQQHFRVFDRVKRLGNLTAWG